MEILYLHSTAEELLVSWWPEFSFGSQQVGLSFSLGERYSHNDCN